MKNNVKIGSYHLLGYDDCGLLKDNRLQPEPSINGQIYTLTAPMQEAKYYSVDLLDPPVFTSPENPDCKDNKCLKTGTKVPMVRGFAGLGTDGNTYVY